MSNVSQSNAEQITGAVRNVADAVREKGRDIRETVQQMGSAAKDAAQAGWDTARSTTHDYLEKGKSTAKAFEESLEIQIRTRPLSAVLLAAGIGFLVAAFWKRGH